MPGSKKRMPNDMTRAEVLAAARATDSAQDFAWDGKDQDDRPATKEELETALAAARRSRGRPAGSGVKTQVAIRIDDDVLETFRATGKGWQTRINAALKDWLKDHSPAQI